MLELTSHYISHLGYLIIDIWISIYRILYTLVDKNKNITSKNKDFRHKQIKS